MLLHVKKKLLLSVLLSYFFFNGFSMSSSPFECHLRATDGEKSARARDDLKSQPESFYLLSPFSACKQQQQSFLSNEFLINSKWNETKRWCGERIKQVANRGDRQKKKILSWIKLFVLTCLQQAATNHIARTHTHLFLHLKKS